MKLNRRHILRLTAVLASGSAPVFGQSVAYERRGPCGKPPAPKPSRMKAAETYPPLPLPATPLRRSEKKRPPRPSALIGKIAYGEHQDWMTDPGDLDGLLRWMNPKLNLNYGSRTVTINDSRLRTIPILYMTGHNHFQVERDWPVLMRRYLEDGGTLIAEACCGWPPFSESFQRIYKSIFPDKPLRRLPMDHPVYRCYHAVEHVSMMENDESLTQAPELYGAEIGCRTALLFSKADLSCGWDHHTHPEGKRYMPGDAMKLGMNMLIYALACRQYAEDFAAQDRLVNEDGDLLVGHIIHNGDWNPNPYAVGKLLSEFAAQCGSSLRIQAKPIRPAPDKLKQFPLIYITGHHSFAFTDADRAAIADYLRGGGVLLANNCCGRKAFDRSLRREAAKILPEAALAPIALNESLFQVPFPMDRVSYVLDRIAPTRPPMEGVALGNRYGVLYFKHGVENGWAGLEYPFGTSLIREDSMKLGVNALVFTMTH